MKLLFIICLWLSFPRFGSAQGVQGNVRISGNVTVPASAHSVTLNWTAAPNATSYNVYRGNTQGGPYGKIASGIATPSYSDNAVTRAQTLYYVITAVNSGNESGYSNETVAVIP